MFHFDLEKIEGFLRLFLWSLWHFVRVVSAIQYCLPKFMNPSNIITLQVLGLLQFEVVSARW
ncbi:hypothetical protein AAW26_22645 [Vibrio alginolyticus]|nr:hypothetical protein AAW26_22645 [Vibrio alginolyticus]